MQYLVDNNDLANEFEQIMNVTYVATIFTKDFLNIINYLYHFIVSIIHIYLLLVGIVTQLTALIGYDGLPRKVIAIIMYL